MNKNRIRLTEQQLHNVIKESVKRIIAESTFTVIGPILQNGETEEEAIEWLNGFDFSEYEPEEETIGYAKYITSANGIDLYYDYAADYYFFALEDNGRKDFMNRLQKGEYWSK